MKKSKSLPLLVLSLFIVACSENPTSSSSEIISDASSEVSSSESTSSVQTEVTETVGTRALLKGIIQNYTTKNIQEVVTKQTTRTKTETITTQFRTKEVYTKTETTTSGVTKTNTDYVGYFDNIGYKVSAGSYTTASSFSAINEDIETQLASYKKKAIDLTAIDGWNYYFEEEVEEEYGKTGTVDESYSATISGDTISIRAKATKTLYSGTPKTFSGLYQFTFMATMDTSYNLTSATLRSVYYIKDKCDSETHLPKEDATPMLDNTYELISLTLGEVEESSTTVSGAMFDISSYYISSITADAYITSRVFDDNYSPTNSSRNTVFAGSNKILINLLGDNGEKYYEPSTACDTETIEITSSNSDYIYKGTSGWEVSEDAPAGTEVILTLGNSLHSNLGTITVTIAANPNASTGTGGSGETTGEIPQGLMANGVTSPDGNGSWDSNEFIFTISSMDTSYIAIGVSNDNELGEYYATKWSVKCITSGIFDIEFDTTHSLSACNVVLKVTPIKTGTSMIAIYDEDNVMQTCFYVTIAESTGDNTGGGTESTYPIIAPYGTPLVMNAIFDNDAYCFTASTSEGSAVIGLLTTNDGPFTAYDPDWTINLSGSLTGCCTAEFGLEDASSFEPFVNYVFIKITPQSEGYGQISIQKDGNPLAIYDLQIITSSLYD